MTNEEKLSEEDKAALSKCAELARISDLAGDMLLRTKDSETRSALTKVVETMNDEHDRILPEKR